MLIHPSILAAAAKKARMPCPANAALEQLDWDKNEFPHFSVFAAIQLGRAMSSPGQHWTNAEIIAKIPEERIRQATLKDLEQLGVQLH